MTLASPEPSEEGTMNDAESPLVDAVCGVVLSATLLLAAFLAYPF
jgi:hypothetical protein